MKPMLINFKHL